MSSKPLKEVKIHPLSEVQSGNIGAGTFIWQFSVVLKEAKIGMNCNINAHVFIENEVVIGDNVTIKSGVQLWDGITLEDNVFIGPNVTFTNDLFPRSKQYPEAFLKTVVKKGASIGANSTLLAGIIIDEFALIGAGSVVTKSVGKNEIWLGSPARKTGYVTESGIPLNMELQDVQTGDRYKWSNNSLILIDD